VITVAQLLARGRALGLARLDTQLLLAHQLGQPRSWLLAHGDEPLLPTDEKACLQLLEQRADGMPLAYLVGRREFHGLDFAVTPAVLVPRPDTELLVDWALDRLLMQSEPSVLDLGTGSGAVAVTLSVRHPGARVTATDLSPDALRVAQHNAQAHGARVEFRLGSWWRGLDDLRFDLVVSNPPYIADGDPHLPALRHEPGMALTSGSDGLQALRQIVAGAPAHLQPRGWLLLEHGHDQGAAVRTLLQAAGFTEVVTRADLAGRDRCSGGCWTTGTHRP
jgi:release factor glutamine methyltransferase